MNRLALPVGASILLMAACADTPADPVDAATAVPIVAESPVQESIEAAMRALPARIEEDIRALPDNVAPLGVWWFGETMGNVVFFEDRGNKQLAAQWVPGDPRRGGRTDIGWASIMNTVPSLTQAQVDDALSSAMATWEGQNCSTGLETPQGTFLEWLFFESDVLHAGFIGLPPGVLGVTFISIFLDPVTGEPSDIDGNGDFDYAYAVVYYNSAAPWAVGSDFDIETVMLHEAGHGLGQAHFGKAFGTVKNGKIHYAPRALMNAGYSQVQQSLLGTDRAGHCSMYGSWPND